MTDSSPDAEDTSALQSLRRQISVRLAEIRQAAGMNQGQFGDAVGVSRYTVNRLERGVIDLREDLARRIEERMSAPGLVGLVADRRQLTRGGRQDLRRNQVVDSVLAGPGLQRLRIVLVDDLDVAYLIADHPTPDARIDIVVPTVAREQALFGGGRPLFGHVEHQIRQLGDLMAVRREKGQNLDVRVYESPLALSPMVLARSSTGTACAMWSVLLPGGGVSGADLPAVSSRDPHVVDRVRDHIDAVMKGSSRIWVHHALAFLSRERRDESGARPLVFSRYEPAGVEERTDQINEDEGYVVAIVVVHARCPRKGYSVQRRVLLDRRLEVMLDRERLSFPSAQVTDYALRRAWQKEQDPGAEPDRSRTSLAPVDATLKIEPYLRATGNIVPLAALKEASRQGLMSRFGLDVDIDRLRPVPLPNELELIPKGTAEAPARWPVLPRLFTLELSADPGPAGRSELSRLTDSSDVVALGYEDLDESDELNDFLARARRHGFLKGLLQDLGVAPR